MYTYHFFYILDSQPGSTLVTLSVKVSFSPRIKIKRKVSLLVKVFLGEVKVFERFSDGLKFFVGFHGLRLCRILPG